MAPVVLASISLACAARGPVLPDSLRALAWEVPAGLDAERVAQEARSADADVLIVSAQADSAWFAALGGALGLALSGPAVLPDGRTVAFFAREVLGDTTLALPVADGDSLRVHDALYRLGSGGFLDILAFRPLETVSMREQVRSFLLYVATDVMQQSVVLLAARSPSVAVSDSLQALLQPVFSPVSGCLSASGGAGGSGTAATATTDSGPGADGLRLYASPPARVRCEDARILDAPGSPLLARFGLGR